MGIKETPVDSKTYYKLMKKSFAERIEEIELKLEEYVKTQHDVRKEIINNITKYKDKFDINLTDYDEFVVDKYISGKFLKVCNGAYLNKDNDYELVTDLYILLCYAKNQKEIYDLQAELELRTKAINLSLKAYTELLRTYYTQVHKELILNGKGYAFSGKTGWTCINRCVLRKNKRMIDFNATRKREAELKKQGKRIYNKEEAEWCERNNIKYEAEDKRVFRNDEYCYEIPLIGCKFPRGSKHKLTICDYRHTSVRGKTNAQIVEECNGDTNVICELPVDLKTKLTLCDIADKLLYLKFIRNEAQKSLATTKADCKNR